MILPIFEVDKVKKSSKYHQKTTVLSDSEKSTPPLYRYVPNMFRKR